MTRAAPDAPYLLAARGLETPRRPVWIMRQAGRYLPEYRAMRERYSFLELCLDADAAAEVTLQPIRRYGFDAAILFTDLLIPVLAMGVDLRYTPGPVLDRRIDTLDAARELLYPDVEHPSLAPMFDTARKVRTELDPQRALIGFVGAPFTMACYLVEGRGSKSWDDTRRLMAQEPRTFAYLLERLADCLEPVVAALCAAGCDAIQVFDSWAGVLSQDDYAEFAAPMTDRLLQAARQRGAIAVSFVNGVAQHLDRVADSPADIVAVDWRLPMETVRRRIPDDVAVQGNMDPTRLFADDDAIRRTVARICQEAGPRGHVFNLGHGILPQTDPAKLAVLVDEVRKW
ncbi:MAG: uroporphyrinogen decarboxylase [Planctomycetes bacterium]|nr:uroporphyrinogen decarboxylase [Planctomycetota bacterium]